MTVFTASQPLAWGELDLPMFGLFKDSSGSSLASPAGFSLAVDSHNLWFLAGYQEAASLHPQARPGAFQAELWKHDVAELFLADPETGRYFEFNLAPNGAWWVCEFTGPRQRAEMIDIAMPGVATFADMAPDGAWLAAMAIPLDLLRARIDFGVTTRLNVAMILKSPAQRFLSVTDLGSERVDFHQPDKFSKIQFAEIPSVA